MEPPFGNPFQRHHRREEEPPIYPPPPSDVHHIGHETDGPPPPPYPQTSLVHHIHHQGNDFLNPGQYAPPPPNPLRTHPDGGPNLYPSHPFSSNVQHVAHESNRPWPGHRVVLPNGEAVRIFCEAETDYSLTIRDGCVVLARRNPHDEHQHWIKDEKYSSVVKDTEGFPAFALVNKATGQALQHATGATKPVRLTPYRPDEFDESILWSMSKDFANGFRTIRMVNNIHLNLDAFHGDKKSGGVHDGTAAVLWEWKKGENQKWKLFPYCKTWFLIFFT